MLITDRVTLGDIRVTDAGYLETFAHTARTGVQQYRGAEAGRPDIDIVNVYRDEAEVFARRSLDTFAKIPVTVDHPAEAVTAANWKRYAVGTTGEEVLRDGERLKIGLKITDAAAVAAVKAGKRELSVGYTTELVWGDGVAPDGTPYQARQTAIAANHIAIVAAGRAGPQCRIGDSWSVFSPTPEKEPVMTLKTVTVDGIPVEVTDQGATVIETLKTRLGDAKSANDKLVTDHASAIAAKDTELAKKDAEIDALKAKVLDDAAIDTRVQARGDLIAKAKAIAATVDTAGKADADIRRAVVVAKLGDAAVKDKPAAYIDARFDILCEEAKATDPVRDALKNGLQPVGDAAAVNSAHAAYATHLTDAWKGATQKGAA